MAEQLKHLYNENFVEQLSKNISAYYSMYLK